MTKAARDICIRESRPVLIEAMTYRRVAVYNVTKAARDICIRESKLVLIEAMTHR